MKLKLLVIVIALSFIGCDDRFDFVKKDNRAPNIYFQSPGQVALTDSLKLGTSIKTGEGYYSLEVNAKDLEGKLSSISFRIVTGAPAKFYDQDLETFTSAALVNGHVSLDIYPSVPGNMSVLFEVTDDIGKSATATFDLFTFENLTPTAIVSFASTKITGPYEYEFDASKSFDRDEHFGGEVTAYEYIINDLQTILTANKITKHHFAGPGGYRIKYRVHDNEGATSAYVTAPQITIE